MFPRPRPAAGKTAGATPLPPQQQARQCVAAAAIPGRADQPGLTAKTTFPLLTQISNLWSGPKIYQRVLNNKVYDRAANGEANQNIGFWLTMESHPICSTLRG